MWGGGGGGGGERYEIYVGRIKCDAYLGRHNYSSGQIKHHTSS